MKVNNLPKPPENDLMQFTTEDWAQLYTPSESLQVELAHDGENMHPCIVLGTDYDKKLAFPLDDVKGLNNLIMRLKMFKQVMFICK